MSAVLFRLFFSIKIGILSHAVQILYLFFYDDYFITHTKSANETHKVYAIVNFELLKIGLDIGEFIESKGKRKNFKRI